MTPTNAITKSIVQYCRLNGAYCERINVISRQIEGRFVKSTTSPGTPDIIGCKHGRFFSVEVKVGKDRQSPSQKLQQERIEQSKGLYFIAKDLDSFIKWFNTEFIQ